MKPGFKWLILSGLSVFILFSAEDAHAAVSGEWEVRGNYTAKMWNIKDAFCYLTHVQGRFLGLGEGVQVSVGANGDWILQSWAQQEGIGARARCVTWDSFGATSNRAYTVVPRSDRGQGLAPNGWTYLTKVWQDSALCLMNLVSGNLDYTTDPTTGNLGSRNFVGTVLQSDGYWYDGGQSTNGEPVESGTFCAWLGHPAHFANFPRTEEDAVLISASEGVCWLNTLTGGFAGSGEQASVYLDILGVWHVSVESQQPGTSAAATCAYFR